MNSLETVIFLHQISEGNYRTEDNLSTALLSHIVGDFALFITSSELEKLEPLINAHGWAWRDSKKKRKIYCYNNGGFANNLEVVALGEDGAWIAHHICSSESHMKHDIGIDSTRHHDQYNAHFGEGNWELEWVPTASWEDHKGVQTAIKLHESKP